MQAVIALFASSRRNGNTGKLMDRVAEKTGIDVIDLTRKNISPYDYDHRNRGDDFEPLMDHVLGFDRIVFASPVYWYAVAPQMKTFLDRISDLLDVPDLLDKGRRLRGKQGYIVCTSIYQEVPAPFLTAFQETFGYLGMDFGGYLHADCRNGYMGDAYEHDIDAFVNRLGSRHAAR